jgi:predicted nucleic acid-binding protein
MLDRSERHYAAAVVASSQISDARWPVFTTNFVLAETHALLLTRLNRFVAARFLDETEDMPVTMVRVTEEDEQRARAIIRQYDDKDFSLTDATSFAVMERLAISQAFTLDRNFAQYGWVVLPAGGA